MPEPLPYARLGEYVLVREVGRGGMGIVYEAMQESLRRRAAVKVLPASPTVDADYVRRFHREAEAAAALTHPNLVTIYGVGQDQGVEYIAMEFLEGESLDKRIQRVRDGLPVDEVIAVGLQVASGLSAAHAAGIIHRDIKPSNLMVLAAPEAPHTPAAGAVSATAATVQLQALRKGDATTSEGSDLRVKVLDFGLAKPLDDATLTASGTILGTPMYMSPEQVRGEALDGRADVYSLGMVLYEASTAFPPFLSSSRHDVLRKAVDEEPPRPRKWRPALPRDLETVILKAIEKDRTRRYASAAALEEDLRRLRNGDPILARAVGPLGRVGRRVARHPILAAAVLVTIGAVLFAGFKVGKGSEASQEVQAEAHVQKAAALRGEGRTAEAILELRAALSLAPKNGAAWRTLGELLLADRQDAAACDALGRAVALVPRDDAAWSALALARGRGGDWKGAFDAADEAVRLAPDSPAPLRARAELRQLHGESEQFFADMQRAKEVEGALWRRKLDEVDALLKGKEPLKALPQLSAFPPGERERAGWVLRRGLVFEALAPEANDSLLSTLAGAGMPVRTEGMAPGDALRVRAKEDLDKALSIGADEPRLHAALARLAELQGDTAAALAEWGKALAAAPDDREALHARARLLVGEGKMKEAMPDLDHLIALDPSDAPARLERGRLFIPLFYDAPVTRLPNATRRILLLFNPGTLDKKPPDPRQAMEDLDVALRAGHEVSVARLHRAAILSLTGRKDEALAELDLLQRESPDDLEPLCARALVLARAREFAASFGVLDEASRRHPDALLPWFARTIIAPPSGDKAAEEEAWKGYQEALMRNPSFLKEFFAGEKETSASKERRFDITIADMGDDYSRFRRGDLPMFVAALASDDARTREMAETLLWKAGPASVALLDAEAARQGGSARAGELAKAIRRVVEAEEDALAASIVPNQIAAAMGGDIGMFLGRCDREARRGGPRFAEALVRHARRGAGDRRPWVLALAGAAAADGATRLFLPLLKDSDTQLAVHALEALVISLAQRGEEPPAEALAMTKNSDPEARSEAIALLAPLTGRRLEEDARAWIRKDPDHSESYAKALLTMRSPEGIGDVADLLADTKVLGRSREIFLLLQDVGDDRVTRSIRKIASVANDGDCAQAVLQLGWCGGEEDVPLLIGLLGAEDGEVVSSAALALGRIGSPRAIEPLRALMKQVKRPADARPVAPDTGLPSQAAGWALLAMGCEDGSPRLEKLIRNLTLDEISFAPRIPELGTRELSAAWVTVAARVAGPFRVLCLAFLDSVARSDQAQDLITQMGKAHGEEEAVVFATALAQTEDPRAVPALDGLLQKTKDPDHRVAIAWALSRCGRPTDAPEAREVLRRSRGDLYAAELLARKGDADAVNLLRGVMRGGPVAPYTIAQATEQSLGMGYGTSRVRAAEALALCGDKEAMRFLAATLDSRDILDRRHAGRTLARASGKDIPYEPLAPRPELEKARKAWEEALK